jgi:adenine-specific DNA-methyltransferase
MDGQSLDLKQDLISQLQSIIPSAFSEGKLDVSQLQAIIGENYFAGDERYQLSWAGKSEAYKVLQQSTTKTLIPNPEQSIDWDDAQNIFIEGENLEVLKVLQKSYYGKVKMIYIDPPYNTGSDSFIYPDKFSETKEEYLKRINEKDDEGMLGKEGLFKQNSKENGHYHSNWLNMMLPRLFLARNLLKDDGVIFVSIDDNEQANLKLLMDEVFGEENFLGCMVWRRRTSSALADKNISQDHEYVIVYQKGNFNEFIGEQKNYAAYKNPDNDPRGDWTLGDLTVGMNKDQRPNQYYDLIDPQTGNVYHANPNRVWAYIRESMAELLKENKISFPTDPKKRPMLKRFKAFLKSKTNPLSTYMDRVGLNTEATKTIQELFGASYFSYSKPLSLINILSKNTTEGNDIILDFFAGSGTLAHAIMELNEEDGGNRKYICVQLPEKTEEDTEAYNAGYKNIADLSHARITKVIEKIKKERVEGDDPKNQQHLGFRKYTLSSSNFKIWRGDMIENVDDLQKQVELFAIPQKDHAESYDMLWELLIKNGVSLQEKIQVIENSNGKIYHTEDRKLAFVLDSYTDQIQTEVIALKPKTVVVLDSLFTGNDTQKTNAQLQFEDNDILFKTV